jgi:hypothetical protein
MPAAVFSSFDSQTAILVALIAGVAGLARGFSGFGAALIFMPAASALVTPAVAAPVLLVMDGVLSAGFLPRAWRLAAKSAVAVMALGAVIGVPLGTYVLRRADPLPLRWAIAAAAVLMLALLMSGWRYHGKPHAAITAAVGALSGLFGGLAQLSGPPVVAYWLSDTAAVAAAVRANIILFFGATTVFSLISYVAAGLITMTSLGLAAVAALPYALGLHAGARLFGRASEAVFRRLCFALIALSVAASLPAWR